MEVEITQFTLRHWSRYQISNFFPGKVPSEKFSRTFWVWSDFCLSYDFGSTNQHREKLRSKLPGFQLEKLRRIFASVVQESRSLDFFFPFLIGFKKLFDLRHFFTWISIFNELVLLYFIQSGFKICKSSCLPYRRR